ncbi:SRPBCC family protein [Parasphingopyxis algicola]|uniref:SRPBCC family protein n=1 Tax=Parasphingopyxis algicola TaxID=2026624 RepID=UPI0015A4CAA5|nr:SRPBCC family protein [Parasphingopyxis algicola]QLC26169.1 SRPBCC family protein [Parasphingopyxis algicola]
MKEEFGTQLENGSLRFVRDLPGPIERVWEHFVDPAKRALWFCGGTMTETPGETFTMVFDHGRLSDEAFPDRFAELKGGVSFEVKLVEFDPPRRLVFRDFTHAGEDGEVQVELEPAGDRVRLTLIQSPNHEFAQLISAAAGWQAHLGLLIDALTGDPRRAFWAEHATAEEHYRAALSPLS